jgi:hypothetical protein
MESIPHTIDLQNGHHRTPAFSESRATNVSAAVYEIAHVHASMPYSSNAPHQLYGPLPGE